jgi:large subunit ribosomal protein L13
MQTVSAKTEECRAKRRWFIVDAEGKVLGRIATEIASILRGKHNPQFTPHIDTGDFVIVINAAKVVLTGKKETDKRYIRHTRWAGGVVEKSAAELRAQKPEDLINFAVRGMLPKRALGGQMFEKLKVYAGADHPHAAQKPEQLSL